MNQRGLTTIIGIIMIAILIVIFPIVLDAVHNIQTDQDTDVNLGVTTGEAVTTADVVLNYDVWNSTNNAVSSVTSDNEDDTPVKGTYVSGTKTLTVTGLNPADTRTLTVVYEYDALTGFTGFGAIVAVTPILIWLAVLFVVIGGMWTSYRSTG